MPETSTIVPACDPPDAAAFTELFNAHFQRVHVNLRRLGVPEAAVDDALQEVFIVVLRHRGGEPLLSERAWILGVARRIAHRWRRGAARQRRLAEALTHEPHEPLDGAAAVASQQATRMLELFLDRLDDDRRAVFVLAELEQLTAPEIAEALQLNLNTVYSRLRAARQAFDRSFARTRLRDARSTGEAAAEAVLLSRARTAYTPSAARQARTLALLMPLVLAGGLAPAGAAASQSPMTAMLAGKTVVWAASIGLAAVVAVGVVGGTNAPTPVATPTRQHSDGVVTQVSAPPVFPSPPQPSLAASARPRRAAPSSRVSPPSPPPAVIDADTLRREAGLLAEARAAIRDRDPATAQALLHRHALEFPDGALMDERRLSQISALCLSGQVSQARAAAEQLARERPDTATRAAAACSE